MKKCQDCKFAVPSKLGDRWDNAQCSHLQSVSKLPPRYHLGEAEGETDVLNNCYIMRSERYPCGPLAKLFEAREPEKV